MALLPALAEGDLATFGAALSAIQAITGRWFAPVQGGTFAPGPSEELVRRMAEWGASGVGQSSWGPAVYGIVDGEARRPGWPSGCATPSVPAARSTRGRFAPRARASGARNWKSIFRRGGSLDLPGVAAVTKSLVGFCVVLAIATLAAQESRYLVPRTPWGDPDLQGLWPGTAMMGVPMERPPASPGALGRGGPGPGIGIGPPGHWGERGTPQRQTSLVVDPRGRPHPADDRTPARSRTAAVPKTWYYDNDGGGPFGGARPISASTTAASRAASSGSILPVDLQQRQSRSCRRPARRDPQRDDPRDAYRPARRPSAPQLEHPQLHGRLARRTGTATRWSSKRRTVNGKTGVGANGGALFHSAALHITERFTRIAADTLHYP